MEQTANYAESIINLVVLQGHLAGNLKLTVTLHQILIHVNPAAQLELYAVLLAQAVHHVTRLINVMDFLALELVNHVVDLDNNAVLLESNVLVI